MLQRRGTTAQWNDVQSTLILSTGEIGLVVEPGNALDGKFKIGNGVDTWANLSFYNNDDQNADIYAKLIASQTFQGSQVLTPNTSSVTPIVVSGAASQSAELQKWRNNSGTTLASIDATGKITAVGGLFNSTVNVNSNKITNVATPTADGDAVNKQYVDAAVNGLAWKTPVNLVSYDGSSFINVPLTGNTNTVTLDGHSTLNSTKTGYRLLLVAQTTASQNGIYTYTDNGTTYTLTRSADADTYQELIGASVYVEEGTAYGTSSWVQSNHYITSFSNQTWTKFNGASSTTAGAGMVADGNIFNVVGTTDRITANADSIDIASTYAGQTSITTLGTVGTGTWNATAIGVNKGGTNITSYTTGDLLYASGTTQLSKLAASNANYVLLSGGTGTAPSWGQIVTDSLANSSSTGNGVTYAKMQYVSGQYKLLGRISSGSGIVEELSADNLITMLNTATTQVAFARIPTGTTSSTVSIGNHTHALDDLSDVVITSPTTRQVLKYNGTGWINELPSGGISVSATAPTGPSSGDAWMDSNDGSLYVYYNDTTSRPAGTNLITNPSFETNTTSWSGTNATIAQSSAFYYTGTKSLKVTPSTTTGKVSFTATTVSSTVYRFSTYVYTEINKNIRVSITSPATNGTTTAVAYGNWTRLDVSFTANATSTVVNIESIDSTDPFYVDAVMLEASATLNDYFDGSSYNSTWTGTAHASTSTTAGGTTSQWVQVRANSALEATILTRMSAVESRATNLEAANPVVVGSVAARSALFPAPVQGNTVFRTDLGYMERYYTAYDAITNPSGTTGTVGWYEYRGGAALSENKLINADAIIWQRGTTSASLSTNAYTADRWYTKPVGSVVVASQVTGLLAAGTNPASGIDSAIQLVASTAGQVDMVQMLESNLAKTLSGKTATFSVYVKTDSAILNPTILIQRSTTVDAGDGATWTTVATSTPTIANITSWTRISVTGTIPTTTATSLRAVVSFGTINKSTNTWLTGMQLEEGPVATPFRRNQSNPQAELAACQRFYFRKATSGQQTFEFGTGFAAGTGQIFCAINFPVQMRTTPSNTPDISDFSTFYIEGIGTPGAPTGTSSSPGARTSPYTAYLNLYASGLTSGQAYRVISSFMATAYVGFSAEL
jgi:hypothetical protein